MQLSGILLIIEFNENFFLLKKYLLTDEGVMHLHPNDTEGTPTSNRKCII